MHEHFKLGNSTIRYICDTQHLNIICIISYFDIFPFFRALLPYIILIRLHRNAGPFLLSFSCYSQYNCRSQYSYNRDYYRSLFNSIAYFAKNTGKHRVFVIAIHTCKCTILILGPLQFGLSHRCTIHNNTGWLLFIVLHLVNRLVWYHSYFTQYNYYGD